MEYELNKNNDIEKKPELYDEIDPYQQPTNKSSMPLIAGILLIISGIIAIAFWGFAMVVLNANPEAIDIAQLQEMSPDITIEQIQSMFTLCGTILCGLSIFPILGGILAIKKKMWGIALVGGILGLFTLGFLIISPILSLVGIILIFISRDEFK
jgi:lysylphosphatidylglycerol synthetase-like protein (DUF2156 family)